jgi:hypothetical protein
MPRAGFGLRAVGIKKTLRRSPVEGPSEYLAGYSARAPYSIPVFHPARVGCSHRPHVRG